MAKPAVKKDTIQESIFTDITSITAEFKNVVVNVSTLIRDRNQQLAVLEAAVETAIANLNAARAEITKAEKIKKNISELIEE
jgi:hypothetical protein